MYVVFFFNNPLSLLTRWWRVSRQTTELSVIVCVCCKFLLKLSPPQSRIISTAAVSDTIMAGGGVWSTWTGVAVNGRDLDWHSQWIIFSNEVNTDLYYLSVAELFIQQRNLQLRWSEVTEQSNGWTSTSYWPSYWTKSKLPTTVDLILYITLWEGRGVGAHPSECVWFRCLNQHFLLTSYCKLPTIVDLVLSTCVPQCRLRRQFSNWSTHSECVWLLSVNQLLNWTSLFLQFSRHLRRKPNLRYTSTEIKVLVFWSFNSFNAGCFTVWRAGTVQQEQDSNSSLTLTHANRKLCSYLKCLQNVYHIKFAYNVKFA